MALIFSSVLPKYAIRSIQLKIDDRNRAKIVTDLEVPGPNITLSQELESHDGLHEFTAGFPTLNTLIAGLVLNRLDSN